MPNWLGYWIAVKFAYFKRKNKMEFQKIDFAKMFDVTVAIDHMEKGAQTLITYMPETVRDSLHSVNKAQFHLVRTTNKAVREFAEVVESVGKEATAEVTKAVEKATKGLKATA
jgi:hypothetical protein